MPVRFLTDAERDRLSRFPALIPPEDLATFFTIAPSDLAQIGRCRGDSNRLGYTLQLCALRYLGYCPEALSTVPPEALVYLAQQLHVNSEDLADYGERSHTRTDHWQEICTYLGFQEAGPEQFQSLQAWLVERALEHNKPTLLLQLAIQKLHTDRIVRPGITVLERLVAAARQHVHQETYHRVAVLLTEECRTMLDQLLVPEEKHRQAPLIRLRQHATSATPVAILEALDRRADLLQHGTHQWDLSVLHPNRRKFLAQLGRKSTAQALQRLAPERRYPVLLAFLSQMLEDTTDEILDLFDRCLVQTNSHARRQRDEFRRSHARAANEKLWMFQNLAQVVLDPDIADDQLRAAIYQRIPAEQLQTAMQECEQLVRPLDDSYFDWIEKRYSYLRQFTPKMLAALEFQAYSSQEPLLQALHLLQRLNAEGRHKIPDSGTTPLGFVPPKWLPYVTPAPGRVDRHYYELCALWQLRDDLRAGNLWLKNSRRYADPDSYLLPLQEWPRQRPDVCRQMQVAQDGREQLQQRQAQLQERLNQLAQTLSQSDTVRLVDGQLTIPRLQADPRSESATALADQIAQRLPHLQLSQLLIEVDRWTHFTRHFEHAGGQTTRPPHLETTLYAAILAQGCNFGLERMAEIADLPYSQLAWANGWYLREETLRAAVTALVDFQYHLHLSQHWGSGTLSSSDGQRFPVSVNSLQATALPRYFGYGQGVTFYTWTADQFSQYGTKVIPATVRDATYVLDEILDNETELPLLEHTTDTSGYTEMVFALFDLLGLQFAPRIRDLADQCLYSLPETVVPPALAPLFAGTVNVNGVQQRFLHFTAIRIYRSFPEVINAFGGLLLSLRGDVC